jgi:hypothetical protein
LISRAMWGAILIFNLGAGVIVFIYVTFLMSKISEPRFPMKNYSFTSATRICLLAGLRLSPILV